MAEIVSRGNKGIRCQGQRRELGKMTSKLCVSPGSWWWGKCLEKTLCRKKDTRSMKEVWPKPSKEGRPWCAESRVCNYSEHHVIPGFSSSSPKCRAPSAPGMVEEQCYGWVSVFPWHLYVKHESDATVTGSRTLGKSWMGLASFFRKFHLPASLFPSHTDPVCM